jgi:hypothetical protein
MRLEPGLTRCRSSLLALAVLALATPPARAGTATLRLVGADTELDQVSDRSWTFEGNAASSGEAVDWTLTVMRGDASPADIIATGLVEIANVGDAPAALGNVVVNLQRYDGSSWTSLVVDVADATSADGSASALVVASATGEHEPTEGDNYTRLGNVGNYVERAASSSLELTDTSRNTVFSLVPELVLSPGQTVSLLYTARFNAEILDRPPGEELRVTALVTAGSAERIAGDGQRGSNLDIDGSGEVEADEADVLTMAVRATFTLPDAVEGNASVLLSTSPEGIDATDGVVWWDYETDVGDGSGSEPLTDSDVRSVVVAAAGPSTGGLIVSGSDVTAPGGARELGEPPGGPYEVPICEPLALTVFPSSDVPGPLAPEDCPPFEDGDVCTYSHGGWASRPEGNNPGVLLRDNFSTVYPGGFVEVGIPGAGGFSMIFTSSSAVSTYIGGGGSPGVLMADLLNPTTSSSGIFGKQVLALRLNVDFSAAQIPAAGGVPFGTLILDTGTEPLDGSTVYEILDAANTALGGGPLPTGYTIATLSALIGQLNIAFDNCDVG